MEPMKEQLRSIFVKALRLAPEKANIGDSNLVRTLGIDSISTMEILIWVEDEFGIVIEDQDLSPKLVDSLDVLAAYVAGHAKSDVRGTGS
jgi:acyl carrier protein